MPKRHYDVYQRSDGRWSGVVTLPTGKRKYIYSRDKDDAQDKLERVRQDVKQGLPIPPERLTVSKYLEQWIEAIRPSLRTNSVRLYSCDIARLNAHLGSRKLSALTAMDIQRCYAALLEDGLARSTVQVCHAILHQALRQAVTWNLIPRNPADAAKAPKAQKKEMQTLSEEEVRTLFEATREHYLHPLWVVLVTTGMRIGEATGLRWQDMDLSGGRITVQRSLQRLKGEGLVLQDTKRDGSRRTVHLTSTAAEVLRSHRISQAEQKLAAGPDWKDEMGLVFTGPRGGPIESRTALRQWERVLERVGLPKLRLHDLRHTAATLLLRRGVHVKVVSEMLGHSDIGITLRIYAHVLPTMQQDAAREMEALINGHGARSQG